MQSRLNAACNNVNMPLFADVAQRAHNLFMRRIDRVQERLRELGMKEADFAELLGETQQTVNNWNRRDLPKARSVEVANALGLRPEWLESGEEPAHAEDVQRAQQPASVRPEDMQRALEVARALIGEHPEIVHAMLGAGIGQLIRDGACVPDAYIRAWLGRDRERRPGGPLTGLPGGPHLRAAEPDIPYGAGQSEHEEHEEQA